MLSFLVTGLSLSLAQTPGGKSILPLTSYRNAETFIQEAETRYRDYFTRLDHKSLTRPTRLLSLCKQLESTLRLEHPAFQGLRFACQSKKPDKIREQLAPFGQPPLMNAFRTALHQKFGGQTSEVALGQALSSVLRGTETPLLTFGINALAFVDAETPATRLDDFIEDHPDENSFVSGLERLFREKFGNFKEPSRFLSLCQQLAATGTFGLPHPALHSLGTACQENNAKSIGAELEKFSKNPLAQEFSAAVRQHVQARGSVEAFADDLSHTLPGHEKPLLAFGIFVLFAT